MAQNKINLLDLDKKSMEEFAIKLGGKAFHGRNLLKWIHKRGVCDFYEMTDLSKKLRDKIEDIAEVKVPEIIFEQPSTDGTLKWVFELEDSQRIETVLIPDGERLTLCVSSQVGCALDCSFCSTAQQGFSRNLTTGEIIGQVWVASHVIGKTPTNVVMMGMGEPLANFNAVVEATELMTDDLAYMISKNKVTISTSGIVPALNRLAELSEVSLAVSLHAPTNELRDKLVPINKKYPLEELIPACENYIRRDRRKKITWEYVMLDNINDTIVHAKLLAKLLRGIPSKINLIPFNKFPGTAYQSSSPERIELFKKQLTKSGIITTTRKTRGQDIDAACGQLVGRVQNRRTRESRKNVNVR
tara:strand:- start:821 stop:1894 length:1074 start_codon:yes stop_codon:yes gene_type:complete